MLRRIISIGEYVSKGNRTEKYVTITGGNSSTNGYNNRHISRRGYWNIKE